MTAKEYNTIEEALIDISPQLSEKERKKQLEAIKKSILQGVPFKDTLEISDDVIEFMYSQGHRLYMIGKYAEAVRFFQMLHILHPQDARFAFGVAACHQMLNHFEESVAWYLIAAMTDTESPLPYYHISDCYVKQGDKESALFFLYKALRRVGSDSKYSTLKERIVRSIESLEKEVAKPLRPGEKK